jgi:hypothetical protein
MLTMSRERLLHVVSLVAICSLAGLIGSAIGGGPDGQGQLDAQLALRQLQSDFHGATTLEDEDLMHSLWADDAVFHGPNGDLEGPDDITAFFVNGPRWGVVASLTPSYEQVYEIKGNTATFLFECVLVDVGSGDPVTEVLSTIPFGSQNSAVEIVQHSTAYGTAVKQGNRWVFKEFGPPPN